MRQVWIGVGVALVAVSLIAVASAKELERAPLRWKQAVLTEGEALYAELCAVCHGLEGRGDGPAAEALSAPVADLTLLSKGNGGVFPEEQVELAIRGEGKITAHGSLEMPAWGAAFRDVRSDWKPSRREGFAELKILTVVSHVESLQQSSDP